MFVIWLHLFFSSALGLSASCSLLSLPPFSEWSDEDLVKQSHTQWEELKKIKSQDSELNYNGRIVAFGLPYGALSRFEPRLLSPAEIATKTFRHYTTEEGLSEIKKTRRLRAGSTPYVNSPYVYTDVTGIFLTLKEYNGAAVGLDEAASGHSIDLKLNPQLAVVQLEPGIYVVPGPSPIPDWLSRRIKDAIIESVDPQSIGMDLSKYAARGYSAMEVPIKIIQ